MHGVRLEKIIPQISIQSSLEDWKLLSRMNLNDEEADEFLSLLLGSEEVTIRANSSVKIILIFVAKIVSHA